MIFIKNNRKLLTALLVETVYVTAYIFSGCTQIKTQAVQTPNTAGRVIMDKMKLITAMFPDKTFTEQGNYYNAGERENYYIENILPGSFVSRDNDELLVMSAGLIVN